MKTTGMMLAVALTAMMGVAQEKTAVVSMIDLVRFHPNREQDRKLMEDTEKEYQEELDKRKARVDQFTDEYEKLSKEARNTALSEKARVDAEEKASKHRAVLIAEERSLNQKYQDFKRQLTEQDTRLLRRVTNDIREKITDYAKANKITLIMDSSTLAYSDPKLDVTDEILKIMKVDPKVRKEAAAEADKK